MGTGYTRNDTSNNIADGNVISAADLDGEFDAIVAAFHASTGHTHDGTSAEGAPVTVLGPAQEYVGDGTAFYPKTNATYDLGVVTTGAWKDAFFTGTVTTAAAAISGNATVGGTLDVTGASTVGGTLDVTGAVTVGSTVDGRDIAADGTKLDGIEAAADVTDTVNVTAAGALMDSEVASLSGIKTLTVPDSTTISTFGATLVDDANASAARTTLGVAIGSDVQAYDAGLADIAGLAVTDGNFIVGNGTNWVAESGATALTSLGISSFAQTILDDADAAAVLATLGLTPESVVIENISVTGSGTNWIFSNFDNSTYYKYRIVLKKNQYEGNFEDGVGLGLRVSTDDQTTWLKTNEYDYSVVKNGGTPTTASSTTYARLCDNSTNSITAESIYGYIDLEGVGANYTVIKSVISIGEDTHEATCSISSSSPVTDVNLFDLRGGLPTNDGPVAATGLTFAADIRGFYI